MHKIIRIIVYSYSPEEARNKAKEILSDRLVQEGHGVFDYGTLFDDDTSAVSGKSRWGNIPSVILADSLEGKKLIDDGMKFTKESFLENVKKVRDIINDFSDEELFEEELLDSRKKILKGIGDKSVDTSELGLFKYRCSLMNGYRSSDIYLYDDDGEAIDKTSHL